MRLFKRICGSPFVFLKVLALSILVTVSFLSAVSHGQTNPFLGEIRLFSGNFAPVGWAMCDGSLLAISQNTALFSILGTTYGGNGTTNFALPDLRGRVPMGAGQGSGLTLRNLGEAGGVEQVTLTTAQMPAHTHAVSLAADSTVGSIDHPQGGFPARNGAAVPSYSTASNAKLAAGVATAASTGGNQPVPTVQPYACINYIIALQGIFPSRN
jgi:microcystin-dependent protein